MPMDIDRNHMESADEGGPVCSIEPALVRGNESSPEQLCLKGMEEYDKGQLIKAMQYYMTALSLNPSFIPALLGAICVLVAMERYQEAQSYLDYVFELDPDIKDAKLLRNIIKNAQSGYPVFDGAKAVEEPKETEEDRAGDIDDDEDEATPETPPLQKAKPYLIALIILIICYLVVSPFFKEQKPAQPDIASIRQSLASEPALKNKVIKAEMKGREIILSGKVANQAERRLAIVITEHTAAPLKIDANKLQIGQSTPEVKPETKPETKPESNPKINTQNNKKNYYTVRQGDTLSLIARNKYGDGIYWKKIQAANPKLLRDQDDLQPGMVIILPD